MILKHFLILVIANCCVDAAANVCGAANLTVVNSNGAEVSQSDFICIQSYTNIYSTHTNITHQLFMSSILSVEGEPSDGIPLFQVSGKMNKGEYAKHVLRDILMTELN